MKDKVIITVVGHDKVGIIAEITTCLAKNNVNILDISQTILQEFFTMILVGDISGASVDLANLKAQLDVIGAELGVKITAQSEKVFKFMHRI